MDGDLEDGADLQKHAKGVKFLVHLLQHIQGRFSTRHRQVCVCGCVFSRAARTRNPASVVRKLCSTGCGGIRRVECPPLHGGQRKVTLSGELLTDSPALHPHRETMTKNWRLHEHPIWWK
ncbi:hypothetical protein GN956_G19071 [Arapaima gigas]